MTIADIAKAYGVSPRMIQMARFVLGNGIPELVQLVERDELQLYLAVEIARHTKADQQNCVAGGIMLMTLVAKSMIRDRGAAKAHETIARTVRKFARDGREEEIAAYLRELADELEGQE